MRTLPLLAILLLLGTTARAQAPVAPLTQKIVGGPATEWCHTVPVTGEVLARSYPLERPEAGFENVSNLNATVVCSGLTYNRRVFIDYIDDTYGGWVQCTLKTWGFAPGAVYTFESRASTVYNYSYERSTMYWQIPPQYNGYFQVVCKLQPKTAIVGFYTIALPLD